MENKKCVKPPTSIYYYIYILICHMARLAEQRYSSATRNQVIFVAPPILQIRLLPWTSTLQHSGPIFTATGGASSSIISSLSTTDSNQLSRSAVLGKPWETRHSPPLMAVLVQLGSIFEFFNMCLYLGAAELLWPNVLVNRWPNGNI